jgi:hypothetical protein
MYSHTLDIRMKFFLLWLEENLAQYTPNHGYFGKDDDNYSYFEILFSFCIFMSITPPLPYYCNS